MVAVIEKIINSAYAVNVGIKIPGTDTTEFTFNDYVSAWADFAIDLGMILATLMIVFVGFIYLTSEGDSTKISTAKGYLLGALMGLAILVLLKLLLFVLGTPVK